MGKGRPSAASAPGSGHPGVGLAILVPGLPQWGWRQTGRAMVLFGSFASALGVGLFAWGTWAGAMFLAFAFGSHVTSAADAIRQAAFPGFGRLVAWSWASAGLGLGCYAPALAVASAMAWPARGTADGYLVDRWAFQRREPAVGDWIWIGPGGASGPGIARVVATAGQEVDWSRDRLRVDGQDVPRPIATTGGRAGDLSFDVPEDFVLVAPASGGEASRAPVLVPRRDVSGRAWARVYPIWSRRFLP